MRLQTCSVSSLILGAFLIQPVSAEDANFDGLDDSAVIANHLGGGVRTSTVAIVETDDDTSIDAFVARLAALGYTPAFIPPASDYAVLSGYDVVILPVSHASDPWYPTFNALAADYKEYVNAGGCLYVGQPNPFNDPKVITWLPYHLKLNFQFTFTTCTRDILDPSACAAEGMTGDDLPWPAETTLEMGSEWTVVESSDGVPGLLVATYGAGHINVDFGHPSYDVGCAYSDAGFAQMFECCLDAGPVPVLQTTWGRIKSTYR